MASRLYPQKNLDMALDMIASIVKKYPDYKLEIYGKSYLGEYEYENRLKKRVQDEGLQDNVFFKGFVTDIHNAIKDATVFLITSNHEGMSNSLMEAMALGLPSISTDDSNGGARALIKDHFNGILIPVNGTEECINAVEEIIRSPKLQQKLSYNALKIREELSIDRIANKWLQYIDSIVVH